MIIIACAYVTLKDFDFNKILKHAPKQTATKQVASNAKISDLGYPEWSYEEYPDYYAENGPAVIDESKFPEKGNINYTGKDSLGRTLAVYGTITYKMVEKSAKEKRPDFKPDDNPSGWSKNKKVTVETSTGLYDEG
jgi:deoxyribonuclease